ncbi:MAG TPA: glycosyl hydrolase [Planctomycetota bacterium]
MLHLSAVLALLLSALPQDEPPVDSEAAEVQQEEGVEAETEPGLNSGLLSGLKLRSIGPALPAGRVVDFAVQPDKPQVWFAATASGGVWKTVNAGTTWAPVFDSYGSYSTGCIEMDPQNHEVLWLGSGENNSQRSVSFGDGVYKSVDGGKSWKNVGLKDSEHIGQIAIHPHHSERVFVAAQGPLWRSGGDRGLYRTDDGGASWVKVLEIDEDTGVNEVLMDPRNPDVMYASSYQRRRHVWTLIDGGPGSAIWKSTDGGETWRKLERGLPKADKGRIGMAISPVDPDRLFAVIEAAEGKGGFFRSDDRGETWLKASSYMSSSPQYYNELVADPHDVDRVYALDTRLQVSEDAGATFRAVPGRNRHVDDHALWIDPRDPDHLLVGCDGGIYEAWDRGESWQFKTNMPITQFYRVSVDTAAPFYNVYGGTQDNNSLGGPARTTDSAGIVNADWFVTVGGDGYETLADPADPMLLYSLWQYGGLVRHDRRNGETKDIKPQEAPGEDPNRWNWDSPLLISPHSHTRLYFASQRLYRSDDRGNGWRAVSGDLTRSLDRNRLEIMGRIWGIDAVAKNRSTSPYGNVVAVSESTLVEGLLYVGTDDGLIQVSEDGGANWRRVEGIEGVPELAYVSRVEASLHDPQVVYAAFHNHKMGDFKPYLFRSGDRGLTWTSIAADLPDRNFVWALIEDHVVPGLLFAGTEFGLFFSPDDGGRWIQLKAGLPTIAVRDLDIQRRENDLVLATFGRSFYVLDDYSPLRRLSEELLAREAALLPVKDALLYVERSRLGGRSGAGSQGAAYYTAPNPSFGATFSFHLKEKLTTRKERRKEAEREIDKDGGDHTYPSWEELRAEDRETEPQVLLTVRDAFGEVVRHVPAPRNAGLHRVAWDLRYPSSNPVRLGGGGGRGGFGPPPSGPLVLPGTYTVTLVKIVDGVPSTLAGPVAFQVVPLGAATLPATDRAAALAFFQRVAQLNRAVSGAVSAAGEAQTQLDHARAAVLATPAADTALLAEVDALRVRLADLTVALTGDRTLSSREEPTGPSIQDRVRSVIGAEWSSTSDPTGTSRDAYRHAADAFEPVLAGLRQLVELDLKALYARLEAAGAPWTPGRLPDWRRE